MKESLNTPQERNHKMSSVASRIAFNGMMAALALVLSLLDNMIPIGLLIPIPGIKLGLANVVSLFLLFFAGWLDALAVIVIRCLVMLGITGPTVFLFSLSGGLLALLVMMLVRLGYPRLFGIVGVSISGAVFHNVGQVMMAAWLLNAPGLLTRYLPYLILIALVTGTLTAVAARPVLRRAKF